MNSVSKRFITLTIGLILIIIAFIINKFELLRAILCILGIIILTYSNSLERTSKKFFIPLFAFIFTCLIISTDYLIVCAFKRTPIFAYSIVSTDNGTVYNAIGYRVWKCSDDDTLKVDPLYKLGYYCSISSMKSEDINNILPTLINNFDSYKDNYIKLSGKVTKVSDSQTIIMETYTEEDNQIKYDDTSKIVINFNVPSSSISNLQENTTISIVGKVEKISQDNDATTIKLIDSSLVDSENTDNNTYNFSVEDNIYCKYDKELWFETSSNIYYKSCIDDLNITIDNNQYNLMNAIKNNSISLSEIEDSSNGYLTNSQDSSIIYNYDDFNILVCDSSYSKDIIVGKTTMSFTDGYCKDLSSDESGV